MGPWGNEPVRRGYVSGFNLKLKSGTWGRHLGNSPKERIRRSSNVVSRVVADEAIVIPIRRGAADMDSIFTFNESGTKLWSLISEGQNVDGIAAHLQSEYGLSPEQASADAAAFISDLALEGLVEPA